MDERGHFVNWEVLSLDKTFLALIEIDILEKNFSLLKYIIEETEEPEDLKRAKEELGVLISLSDIKNYCQEHKLVFLTDEELQKRAMDYFNMRSHDINDNLKN